MLCKHRRVLETAHVLQLMQKMLLLTVILAEEIIPVTFLDYAFTHANLEMIQGMYYSLIILKKFLNYCKQENLRKYKSRGCYHSKKVISHLILMYFILSKLFYQQLVFMEQIFNYFIFIYIGEIFILGVLAEYFLLLFAVR